MVHGRVLLSLVIVVVWNQALCANLPPSLLLNRGALLIQDGLSRQPEDADTLEVNPAATGRERVREGVPAPLCAVHCGRPRAGPVCAFDAAGTARTFATLCELEAVSCRESTFYAITSLGEC